MKRRTITWANLLRMTEGDGKYGWKGRGKKKEKVRKKKENVRNMKEM